MIFNHMKLVLIDSYKYYLMLFHIATYLFEYVRVLSSQSS